MKKYLLETNVDFSLADISVFDNGVVGYQILKGDNKHSCSAFMIETNLHIRQLRLIQGVVRVGIIQ